MMSERVFFVHLAAFTSITSHSRAVELCSLPLRVTCVHIYNSSVRKRRFNLLVYFNANLLSLQNTLPLSCFNCLTNQPQYWLIALL